jgi:hypothetical protein
MTLRKNRDSSMLIKSIAAGLLGLAIAGILIISCEKSNGPEPYICNHLYDSLLLMVKTDQGQVPIGPAIPLDSLNKLIITDTSVQAMVNMPEYQTSIFIDSIGKIVFK